MPDPTFQGDIANSTLRDVMGAILDANFFVEDSKLALIHQMGNERDYDGGNGMSYPFTMQGPDILIGTGQPFQATKREVLATATYMPAVYTAEWALDLFKLDVMNSGSAAFIDLMDTYRQLSQEGLDADVAICSWHHGQPAIAGQILDDGTNRVNGDAEFMNDGVTNSWEGSVFSTIGGQARNGAIGNTMNSIPYYFGASNGTAVGLQTDDLDSFIGSVKLFNAGPTFAVTSTAFITALATQLKRQARFIGWNVTDSIPGFVSINYMGCEFFPSSYAPSRHFSLLPNIQAHADNTTDTAGTSTAGQPYSFISNATPAASSNLPASTQISVGEVVSMFDPTVIDYIPVKAGDYNYGVEINKIPNAVKQAIMQVTLALDIVVRSPRRCRLGYGVAA